MNDQETIQDLKQKLRLAESLLSTILDGNPIPSFILDKNHKVLYWNQTFEKISGIRAVDVIGTDDQWKPFYDHKRPVMADLIIDQPDEKVFWSHYKNNSEYTTLRKSAIKEGAYESQDFFPRLGKEGMWLFATACPLTDEQGEIIGAMETFQDVTSLINARKESRRNEEKYRSVFTDAGDALLLLDHDRIIDCNTVSLSLFQTYHDKMIGYSIFSFFQREQTEPIDAKVIFTKHSNLAYGGITSRFFWKFKSLAKKEFDAHVTMSRIDIEGRYALQVVIRDMTEQIKAERELLRLRHYLSDIIQSMPSVLIAIDEKGGITHMNSRAENLAAMTSAEAIGRYILDCFPGLRDKMGKIHEAIEKKTIFEESRIPHETRESVTYENLTVFPLSGEGSSGAVIRIDDVTEQVHMEEMMIHSEKMLSVGSLAAGMAHELNNPLAGMMQNAQVILNRLTGDVPANQSAAQKAGISLEGLKEYMRQREIIHLAELINSSGKRAAEIIRNMLAFARKGGSRKTAHHLANILDKTILIAGSDHDLMTNYDFKKICITRHYNPDVPAVCCDEGKIQQVFWNILKNGAEAMQEGTDLPEFHLRIFKSGEMVIVEIEDNGPGMDENIRRHLFEPFFTTKGFEKGTGLGLAVAYFIIVKDHGGKIMVENGKKGGTKFIIQLRV